MALTVVSEPCPFFFSPTLNIPKIILKRTRLWPTPVLVFARAMGLQMQVPLAICSEKKHVPYVLAKEVLEKKCTAPIWVSLEELMVNPDFLHLSLPVY